MYNKGIAGMEDLKERVNKVLARVKGDAKDYLESASLVSGGILDSIEIMDLILELESEFAISIDSADILLKNFESVNSIADLVEKSLG